MSAPDLPPAAARVQRALAAAGSCAGIRVLPEPAPTAAAAAAQLGCPVGAIANSLVFTAEALTAEAFTAEALTAEAPEAGPTPVLVLHSGARRVDLDRLRAALGARRVRRASPEEVRAATGQAIGGVAPLGHPAPLRTLVDAALAGYDVVWAAGGHPHTVFATTYDELVGLTHGTPADVGEPAGGQARPKG